MSLARNVATVGGATMLSRLLGFFRDVGIAAVLGAGVLADAFFVALLIPNLFRRLLAESALNSAFVPMWLRVKQSGGPASAQRLGEEVAGTMLAVLGGFALLCILFAPIVIELVAPGFKIGGERFPHAVTFVRLSAPYVAIAGLVAVAVSVLNAERRVGAAAFGLVVFNCVMLLAVAVLLAFRGTLSAVAGSLLSAAIVAAGAAQLVLVGSAMLRIPDAPIRPRLHHSEDTRRFFQLAIPGIVAAGIPQLKLMAGTMVASSSQASVSWLYYANRLYELPLGVVSIAIASVMVPMIAASVRSGTDGDFAAAQSRAFEIGLGLALPAALAFAVLADPIVSGLFERGAFSARDTGAVAAALAAICAGLPGHVLEKVLGAISFAHEDTRTPMFAALGGLVTAVAGALILFPHFGHVGVAAAIAISGWVGAAVLALILTRRRWLRIDGGAKRRLPGIILATLLMGIAIIVVRGALMAWLPSGAFARASGLAVLVALGLLVYLAGLQLLGVARLRELIFLARRGL